MAADAGNPETGPVPEWHTRPVVLLLLGFISGILMARYLPGQAGIAWGVAIAAGTVSALSLWRRKQAAIAPIALFGALGYLAIAPLIIPSFPPASVLQYLDGKSYRISGRIDATPIAESFRTRCNLSDLHLIGKDPHGASTPLPGRLRCILYGASPELLPGNRIIVSGKIRPLRNFSNPGGFNYRQFMAYQQVWGTVYATGKNFEIQSSQSATGNLTQTIFKIRQTIDNAIAGVSTGDRRAVLSALIIGKTDYITRQLRDDFSQSGTSHLLAISGLHVGIIATCSFFIFRLLLGFCPFLLRRGLSRKCAALLTFAPVIGYGLISGMSPSTQRAVIMICALLSAYLIDRDYDPANTLAAAALAILIAVPPSLFSISFQLSFAAVTAIFLGLRLFPGPAKSKGDSALVRFGKSVVVFLAVSAFAIVGTAPLVMYYFNQFTFLGLVSNCILIPLIGFLVVPLGLLSTILYPFFETAAVFGYEMADRLTGFGLLVIKWLANLPFGAYHTIRPSVTELVCTYILILCIPLIWRPLRKGYRPLSGTPVPAVVLAAIASVFLIGDVGYWIYQRHLNPTFRVTVLDVGQGSAALLELPKGKTMLIDGGGFSNNDIFDVGAMVLAPYLCARKIRTLDTVLVSHADADHLNGLTSILERFRIGRVISTHLAADSIEYQRFLKIIAEKGIPHPPWEEIDRRQDINGVAFELLHPLAAVSASDGHNNNSIVVRATYKGVSILFPGDIESNAEVELVSRERERLAADVLLSPHHGSRSSSTSAFLEAVNPKNIVISVRKDRFGLPSAEVLDRYERLGCRIFRTDMDGAVRIVIEDGEFHIQPTL